MLRAGKYVSNRFCGELALCLQTRLRSMWYLHLRNRRRNAAVPEDGLTMSAKKKNDHVRLAPCDLSIVSGQVEMHWAMKSSAP